MCHQNPSERSRFIRCIYNLLNSNSPAVRYEAAGTLVTLSNAPTAVKAAASAYIELIVKARRCTKERAKRTMTKPTCSITQ